MPPEPELSRRSKIGSAKLFQIRKVSQNPNILYDTFLHMFWYIYIYILVFFNYVFSVFHRLTNACDKKNDICGGERHYFEAEAIKQQRLKQMRLENQAYLSETQGGRAGQPKKREKQEMMDG